MLRQGGYRSGSGVGHLAHTCPRPGALHGADEGQHLDAELAAVHEVAVEKVLWGQSGEGGVMAAAALKKKQA